MHKPLLQALQALSDRLDRFETLIGKLGDDINAVRTDTLKSVDEKFGLVCDVLNRFDNAVAAVPTTPPDYAPFFRDELGAACWNWIETDYQKMFIMAENNFRCQMSNTPNVDKEDFSDSLLQYCRPLEFLLSAKLGEVCKDIRNMVSNSSVLYNLALEKLSVVDELELALDQRGALSMTKIASILHVGKVLELACPGTLKRDTAILLGCSPGPADIEQIAILMYIAVKLRNGKTHHPEFTSVREMRTLRKLALGLNDQRGSVNLAFWAGSKTISGSRMNLMKSATDSRELGPISRDLCRLSGRLSLRPLPLQLRRRNVLDRVVVEHSHNAGGMVMNPAGRRPRLMG